MESDHSGATPAEVGREGPVILTGATGFIGGRLWPALEAAGYAVRGVTRNPERARRRWPGREWVGADLEAGGDLGGAMRGGSVAVYLVHGMAGGADYREREVRAAARFAQAAAGAGLQRIVYLGGVAPSGEPSEHLRSRLEVGEALLSGPVPALELRASVIVGAGSLSWLIVRDLAARLPAMVLPRWLRSRTQPVAVADVVAALVAGLATPLPAAASFDLPGPDTLTGRTMLELAAQALGLKRPLVVEVPLLTPWLSSHWVRLVTRADWAIARELVHGMLHDLLARDASYWARIGHTRLEPFGEAAVRAVQEERAGADEAGSGAAANLGRICERLMLAARHA